MSGEDARARDPGMPSCPRHRRPLVGGEVEHLVQREGQHDEVEAERCTQR